MFKISDVIHKHNVRILGNERAMEYHLTFWNSPGVMKWCAILNEHIVGSYFLSMPLLLENPTEACLLTMRYQSFDHWEKTLFLH